MLRSAIAVRVAAAAARRSIVTDLKAAPALRAKGGAAVEASKIFEGKKVVLVGVVGAFTGTCTVDHVPGYAKAKASLAKKGVNDVVVVSVNDHLVLDAWKTHALKLGADSGVTLMSDVDAAFTRAVGMEIDLSGAGLGVRSKRYAMVVDNGKIVKSFVEPVPSKVTVTGAENVVANL
eukprot:a520111_60.p1 GENE.a520111_60~~a520111_60.p1  ORF type:complete len:185 (+),score=78.36 a520111_60:27-557(+)